MNAVLIQMIILILCYLYILITISSKNYQKKGIRASLYLCVLAGFSSYIFKSQNWLDFILLLTPIMLLYQFEEKLRD